MVHSKYKFTPQDIAVYLLVADLPRFREDEIIADLFQAYNNDIVYDYRNDLLKLRRHVYEKMILLEMNDEEYEEAQLIMREFQIEKSESHPDYYHRIKLRTLLKDFGYKRRSAALMESINRTMQALHLQAYLKQYEPCDLAEIPIDQMVVIRIKT